MFPVNDDQFEEHTITKVSAKDYRGGYELTFDDGWSLWSGENCPVVPTVGTKARLYGKGVGYPVRGLYIGEHCAYYHTEQGWIDHQNKTSYGANAQDWLSKWDADGLVWSLQMGGMGPGYEQCIQIAVAETLRILINRNFAEADFGRKEVMESLDRQLIEHSGLKQLGLSGAQVEAAKSLAAALYLKGPVAVLTDPKVKGRKIMVQRKFPNIYG